MPKLFEYFGLVVRFYSNEHEPIHVHGVYRDRESRADLVIRNGRIVEVRFMSVKGRKPLGLRQERDFRKIVAHFDDVIVQKWVDFFVLHKHVEPEIINKRLP